MRKLIGLEDGARRKRKQLNVKNPIGIYSLKMIADGEGIVFSQIMTDKNI
jgi:hypothetical protein